MKFLRLTPKLILTLVVFICFATSCKDNNVRPEPDLEEEYLEEVAEPEGKDIIATLQNEAELSNFVGHIETEELPFFLTDNQLFTVFAPTNEAFPAEDMNIENELLSYYIVKGSYGTEELLQIAVTDSSLNSYVNSLSGGKIYIQKKDDNLILRGNSDQEAQIIRSINTSNGIIHIIDNAIISSQSSTP